MVDHTNIFVWDSFELSIQWINVYFSLPILNRLQ